MSDTKSIRRAYYVRDGNISRLPTVAQGRVHIHKLRRQIRELVLEFVTNVSITLAGPNEAIDGEISFDVLVAFQTLESREDGDNPNPEPTI